MNYLAHGRLCLHDPWLLAGTAVPDWLRVLHARARIHSETASRFADHGDPRLAALARGIVRQEPWIARAPCSTPARN